jgi:uncharacterized protein (UPF0297 family)
MKGRIEMPISEPTAVFSIRDDRDMEIKQAVLQVYRALEEKGYNPINQLVGYILSEDPTYITTYKNARAIIRRIDRDDLLQDKQTLDRMWILRKYLADMNPIEAMDFVKDRLEKTKDNDEFLMSMNS